MLDHEVIKKLWIIKQCDTVPVCIFDQHRGEKAS
jgi:hypothetical protein